MLRYSSAARCERLLQVGTIPYLSWLAVIKELIFPNALVRRALSTVFQDSPECFVFVRRTDDEHRWKVCNEFRDSSQSWLSRTGRFQYDLKNCRVESVIYLRCVYIVPLLLYGRLAACTSHSFKSFLVICTISLARVGTSFNIRSTSVLPCHTMVHVIRLFLVMFALTLPSMVIIS